MTPLARRLADFLPGRLVPFALAAFYALALVATILAVGMEPPDLLYLDVQGAQ